MKLKEIFKIEKKFTWIYIGLILSLFVYSLIFIAGILFRLKLIQNPFIPDEYLTEFVVIIPGPLISDILILYLLPVVILLLFLKIAPLILTGYIKLHKISYLGRNAPEYGMIRQEQKRTTWILIKRSWTIGFFSFTIAAYLVNIGMGPLFRANMRGVQTDIIAGTLNLAEAMFLGTFFFMFLALFLALPIWLLEDSGVMFYRIFPNDLRTPTLRGTYVLFERLLEAFTGLSTVILLYNIIVRCFSVLNPGDVAILTPLILIFLPLFVTGIIAFALIVYEQLIPETIDKIHKKLLKKGYYFIEVPASLEILKIQPPEKLI
ncbi:MAG: hypothetical protein JW891_09200 [Candidatus Lokiarchaeota archaeon]|nr:hypothetical protein [Candidatus Lokiarchaeota archaeon]